MSKKNTLRSLGWNAVLTGLALSAMPLLHDDWVVRGASHQREPHRAAAHQDKVLLRDRAEAVSRSVAPAVKIPRQVSAAPAPAPIEPGGHQVEKPKPVARPVAQPVAQPDTRVIRIATVRSPRTMQAALDRCIGPVQVNWPWHPPQVAQHDYCGGAWFATLRAGDAITIKGGTLGGSYRVDRRREVPKGSSSSTLNGMGDVVLQTCIGSRLVLVGLQRS